MKVAVAIDSFKGSMTSMQAGNACKEGILAAARALWEGGAAAARALGGPQPLGTGNLQQIIWMLS